VSRTRAVSTHGPGVARRLLGLALSPLGLLLLPLLAGLALLGETRSARRVGALAILALAGTIALAWLLLGRAGPGVGALFLLGAGAAVTGLAILPIPRLGSAPPDLAVGLSSLIAGHGRPREGLIDRFIPEIDRFKLVAAILTRLVPGMTRAEGLRVRRVLPELAREMEADPSARGVPAVSRLTISGLLFGDVDVGHSYTYTPPPGAGDAMGMVVFLHGNGGNTRACPWALRPFADRHRFAILCPTSGFGFWGPGGVEAVERALSHALERFPVDPGRVYLAGLSDGGKGVTRSASAHPRRYRGLIYLSPTMRPDELSAPAFRDAWRGRPILVVQGDRDRLVPKESVDPAVTLLREQGADVSYEVFPGEDHFLFFARREELCDLIGRWIERAESSPR
jgi:pimeloyl-ACP methyl ester carboxylesterase